MNQQNQQEENCLLCESSKEAMEKLDSKAGVVNRKKPKSFRKGLIILGLIGLTVFSVYIISILNFSLSTPQDDGLSVISDFKDSSGKGAPRINALAPDFVSEDVFGNKITLSDYRGKKPVLLVFWATWCGVCAQELEDLKTFTQKHQDKIQVVVVDSGEPKGTIRDYIRQKNINFLMLLDEQKKIWNQYLVRGTPSHFLIDKEGIIVTLQPGLASLGNLETMLKMVPK